MVGEVVQGGVEVAFDRAGVLLEETLPLLAVRFPTSTPIPKKTSSTKAWC